MSAIRQSAVQLFVVGIRHSASLLGRICAGCWGTLFVLLAMTNSAKPVVAQSPELHRQLSAACDTVWRARLTNDTSVLRRYLPAAAVSVDLEAEVLWSDRSQIVQSAQAFVRSPARLVDIAFSNTRIEALGQSALIRSDYRTIVETDARLDTIRGRVTELFVRQGNSWVNPYRWVEPLVNAPNSGREILLRDTMGANYSIGDSATIAGTAADYDPLIGSWEFRFQSRQIDGSFSTPITGHWTFEKKPGDGLVEDRWRPDDPAIPMGISLYSYRTFNQQRKVWQILGTSSLGGETQPGLTWSDGKDRFVVQHSRDSITRIRYSLVDADHFVWRSDRSYDGGQTWILDFAIMEANRIGK